MKEMNEIVENKSITVFNALNLDSIRTLPDIKSAKECLARLSGFQKALQEADKFFAMSVEFAKLEAAALIRTVELGGERQIKGDRSKAARWLFNMSEAERNLTIEKCANGLTITQIYRMEQKPAVGIERIGIEANAKKDQYLLDAEEMGIIDISDFIDPKIEESHKPTTHIAWHGTKENLRQALLKNGFVGCGFNSQIYIDPQRSGDKRIRDAIATRLRSICADIDRLSEIAHTANIMLKDLPQARKIVSELANQFIEGGEE